MDKDAQKGYGNHGEILASFTWTKRVRGTGKYSVDFGERNKELKDMGIRMPFQCGKTVFSKKPGMNRLKLEVFKVMLDGVLSNLI